MAWNNADDSAPDTCHSVATYAQEAFRDPNVLYPAHWVLKLDSRDTTVALPYASALECERLRVSPSRRDSHFWLGDVDCSSSCIRLHGSQIFKSCPGLAGAAGDRQLGKSRPFTKLTGLKGRQLQSQSKVILVWNTRVGLERLAEPT